MTDVMPDQQPVDLDELADGERAAHAGLDAVGEQLIARLAGRSPAVIHPHVEDNIIRGGGAGRGASRPGQRLEPRIAGIGGLGGLRM